MKEIENADPKIESDETGSLASYTVEETLEHNSNFEVNKDNKSNLRTESSYPQSQ